MLNNKLCFKYDNKRYTHYEFQNCITELVLLIEKSSRFSNCQVIYNYAARGSYSRYLTIFVKDKDVLLKLRISNHHKNDNGSDTIVSTSYRSINEMRDAVLGQLSDLTTIKTAMKLKAKKVMILTTAFNKWLLLEDSKSSDRYLFQKANLFVFLKQGHHLVNVTDDEPELRYLLGISNGSGIMATYAVNQTLPKLYIFSRNEIIAINNFLEQWLHLHA